MSSKDEEAKKRRREKRKAEEAKIAALRAEGKEVPPELLAAEAKRNKQKELIRAKRKAQKDEEKKKAEEEERRRKEEEERKRREEEERRRKEEEERKRKEEEERKKKAAAKKKQQSDSEEDDGYGDDYEDDFEDYEDDDFEEDDDDEDEPPPPKPAASSKPSKYIPQLNTQKAAGGEKDEILAALHAENREAMQMATSRNKPAPTYSQLSSEANSPEPDNTFTSTIVQPRLKISKPKLNREQAQQVKRRGRDLKKLVNLKFMSFDIFSQKPTPQYHIYLHKILSRNVAQKFTQCRDDWVDVGIQTETADSQDVAVQNPDEKSGESAPKFSTEHDATRLISFLHSSSFVCSTLLDENIQGMKPLAKVGASGTAFSDSMTTISPNAPYLRGKVVQDVCNGATNEVLVAYGDPSMSAQQLTSGDSSQNYVLVWDTETLEKPKTVLLCDDVPTSCLYCPGKPHIAIAGTRDGSLVLWDLRESFTMHTTADDDVVHRYPTFHTYAMADGHAAKICKLAAVPSTTSNDQSNQIASLDVTGVLILWFVIELEVNLFESEFGLSIGGKVKLQKGGEVNLNKLSRSLVPSTVTAIDLSFHRGNGDEFVVPTTDGSVAHGFRYGDLAAPKEYFCHNLHMAHPTTVDFSPFFTSYFLVGYNDGSICLFNASSSYPVETWRGVSADPIDSVRWSPSRPAVFVVSTQKEVIVYDIVADSENPRCRHDHKAATGHQMKSILSFSNDKAEGIQTNLAICCNGSDVEVHLMSEDLSELAHEEVKRLETFLTSR